MRLLQGNFISTFKFGGKHKIYKTRISKNKMDLNYFIYHLANFEDSKKRPTSASRLIKSNGPYYYQWRQDEGMDIVVFDNPNDQNNMRFFRYSKEDIYQGVDLDEDIPSLIGNDAINFIHEKVKNQI